MSTILSDAGLQFADASLQPSAARPQLFSLGVTQASSALTIASQAFSLAFKTSTTSGAVTTVTGSPTALVIPSGATLGLISGVASSIIVAVLNNGGTLEYAVQNLAGGTDMSEGAAINTTAITTGSLSNNVWYSNTARTGVFYSVFYRIDSTQTTAGTWANTLTLQGAGGQALAALSSLGFGQTWQDVSGSRVLGTTYYNTSGKVITISGYITNTGGAIHSSSVSGVVLSNYIPASGATSMPFFFIVPVGMSYNLSLTAGTGTITVWRELR